VAWREILSQHVSSSRRRAEDAHGAPGRHFFGSAIMFFGGTNCLSYMSGG